MRERLAVIIVLPPVIVLLGRYLVLETIATSELGQQPIEFLVTRFVKLVLEVDVIPASGAEVAAQGLVEQGYEGEPFRAVVAMLREAFPVAGRAVVHEDSAVEPCFR